MSEQAPGGARRAIDRQRIAEWGRALFKGTAYLTLFLLDFVVISTLWNDFDGISRAGWFAIFGVAVANTIMLPKVVGAIAVIGVFVLLWFIPTDWFPPYAGLIIGGVILVYVLFTKLDAINANLIRANELKERETKSDGPRKQ
jgi:hypothetical protein